MGKRPRQSKRSGRNGGGRGRRSWAHRIADIDVYRRRLRLRQLRLMIWSGMLLGLLGLNAVQAFEATSSGSAPRPALVDRSATPAQVGDPYARSRSYRAELERQEGAPDSGWGSRGSKRAGGGSIRVIDGDTFDYGGERIRIADIDTPELRARCPEEAARARAATARLGSLLAAGPFELHRSGRDEDRYGRKLRVVTRGGRSLGDSLVAEGLARTWAGRREPWC
jgi:micrococcal nuclease